MSGYTFEGPKWNSPVVTWSFAQSTLANDQGIPFSDPIAAAAYQAIVQQAFADWAAASGLTFVEVPDSANADVRVGFADLNPPALIGQTSWTSNGNVFNPDVVIRLEDPAQDPLISSSGTLVYQGTQTTFMQLVLHEIGHALGLGEATDPNAVTYQFLGPSNQNINATDIQGIQALYGNPPAPNPTLVQYYENILQRAPDQAGLTYWETQLATHTLTLSQIENVLVTSPEAQQIVVPIVELYQTALNRAPDQSGLAYWVHSLESGASLSSIAQNFLTSPEGQKLFGSNPSINTAFVTQVYQDVLGRSPDQAGLSYWLQQTQLTPGGILMSFILSPESAARNLGAADNFLIMAGQGIYASASPNAGTATSSSSQTIVVSSPGASSTSAGSGAGSAATVQVPDDQATITSATLGDQGGASFISGAAPVNTVPQSSSVTFDTQLNAGLTVDHDLIPMLPSETAGGHSLTYTDTRAAIMTAELTGFQRPDIWLTHQGS